MWGQVHQVDVPTNDLQVVDFTHIYSSFIGSNYIHVMAVIPELVQPARVRMCSGFQFENTNTKKNMLKGPWFSLISSQVMEAVWNSGCWSWILGILVDNCKCWTGLWNMRIKAKPSQSSDLAKKTKLAKKSSHWLIAINKNWYQTSKPGDTGVIISTKQTKEWIAKMMLEETRKHGGATPWITPLMVESGKCLHVFYHWILAPNPDIIISNWVFFPIVSQLYPHIFSYVQIIGIILW